MQKPIERKEMSASRLTADRFPGIAEEIPNLEFTGERIIPGKTEEALFREHEERYVFAGQYVAGKDVLDVACGTGIGTQYLRKAGAKNCIGLDIDGEAIDYARAAYQECLFLQSDAVCLNLPDECVDVVVSFETIEHLADQAGFLEECRRVLRAGGLLICSTPNRAISHWGERNPFHVHELGVAEFRRLVERKLGTAELYAQRMTLVPAHVYRFARTRILEGLGIRRPLRAVKRWIRGEAPPLTFPKEFGEDLRARPAIGKFRFSPFSQPTYVIAVAVKRAS